MKPTFRSYEQPKGNYYRVAIEKNGERDFMALYAPSETAAIEMVRDAYKGTSYQVKGIVN